MPKHTPGSFTNRLTSFLASEQCFWLLIAIFILEALWIALSGRYPMAFDENYHLGIIRLYTHHISPFWTTNSPGVDALGPVARDPSYLYQWLMSFPYRVSSNVIFLRVINIGLFTSGLLLYRRLLLKTGAPRAIVHFCLALFVLIPVVPLLAAQINYDNLFLPLTALALLLALSLSNQLNRRRLNLKTLAWLFIVITLTCLVKYAFLPIALAIVLYLAIRLLKTRKIKASWESAPRSTIWLMIAFLILSFGLFTERYGINLARYHKPVASCEKVLSVQQCKAYSPWNRDYKYAQMKPVDATTSPLVFTADWFYGMWFRTFFAVDGPASIYATRGPFVLPAVGAIVFSVTALGMTLVSFRQVLRNYNKQVLWLFIFAAAAYVAALWLDGYQSFLQTGQPVALNGRYLVPIFPLLLIILALGANTYLMSHDKLKLALAVTALVCMLWGGGALTYILRSGDAWYWPNSPLKSVNHTVQDTIGPLVPGNSDPMAFMGHHGT
jgi:heme/copper-type cytochrome/quinol oxidase subunit 2